ncbi:hypothetical protein GCM10018793_20800 [Streptomyces sulfonofaciens]|uniref:Uncharacterized protein n=1 Tax=Streptomyces sulfonofaciens TaxID=68272 RepID=A0A919G1N9_9ACTN|nr:hypothetical protein [Streptomyces sulfonofaciens]GHH75974.1 hypothetical protein GCM10018793_20800 [Streptomyces sulfonofaciens]
MQSLKRPGRPARTRQQPVPEPAPEGVEAPDAEFDLDDMFETYRVICPDCAQSIALLADEDVLPEHALCPSPWDPFGLQVCAGTGRAAADALSPDTSSDAQEQEAALLLTLPQSLDWRTQPFSHVGGPGSRPMQAPQLRSPAA